MLPPNIDLTERSDFGLGSGIFMDTPVDLDDLDAKNNMSIDEYDYLVWLEGIFGRKRLRNQKWKLFPRIDLDVPFLPRIPLKDYRSQYNTTPSTFDKIPWWCRNAVSHDDNGFGLFNRR